MTSAAYTLKPADCKPSITEVITNYGIELRPSGKEPVGLCPFHADKHPSLSVNEDRGLFHCFGCQAGGDVIRFVELIEKISFKEACERLQLATFKPRPRPHRDEAATITRWAHDTSRKICDALRGDKSRVVAEFLTPEGHLRILFEDGTSKELDM